eukprot:6135823-Prymnesium_polylepis.1
MVIIADKAVTVSVLFAAGGVLAFYAAVVLAIGRFVRSIIGGTRYRLIVDEMPDTRGAPHRARSRPEQRRAVPLPPSPSPHPSP